MRQKIVWILVGVIAAISASSLAQYYNVFQFGNPTGTVGTTATNGSAITVMRSDAAPSISQSISPTWTGNQTFSPSSGVGITINGISGQYGEVINGANSATGNGLQVTGGFTGAGNTNLVTLQDVNNTNGVNILMTGNGASNPNKYVRVLGGVYQIVNSAYSSNILTLTDAGVLQAPTINATTALQSGGAAITPTLTGTTGSIGGSALLAGACSSGTVSIANSTTSMVALTDPNTYPGDGTIWDAQVTSAGTVTVKVCAIIALTPTASTYNVRVIQ